MRIRGPKNVKLNGLLMAHLLLPDEGSYEIACLTSLHSATFELSLQYCVAAGRTELYINILREYIGGIKTGKSLRSEGTRPMNQPAKDFLQ